MADLKETLEVLDAVEGVLKDLIEAKSDDGKVSAIEALKIALVRSPEAVRAFMGLDAALAEIKDISSAEAKQLADKAIAVGQLALKLAGL
jgi:hypothetical protein